MNIIVVQHSIHIGDTMVCIVPLMEIFFFPEDHKVKRSGSKGLLGVSAVLCSLLITIISVTFEV